MKELKSVLEKSIVSENFFKNIGAQPTLVDAITQGKHSIKTC